MKKTDLKELRAKDAKNLVKLASEKREKLAKEKLAGKVTRNLRRELAQILTILGEKK